MREAEDLNSVAKWQLASAFILAGQKEAAENLVKDDNIRISKYFELGNTYGSHLRDKAIVLTSMAHMNKRARGKELVEELSRFLSSKAWYSTHSTAFSIIAIAEFTGKTKTAFNFSFTGKIGNSTKKYNSGKAFRLIPIDNIPSNGTAIEVINTNESAVIYCTLTSKGSPPSGSEQPGSSGLDLSFRYQDINNNSIEIANITQGVDFIDKITVSNTGRRNYENLALTYIVPSGWQIHNPRFETGETLPGIDHQDIRDDRVYTYFSLKPGESKTFPVLLNASFMGKYYKPAVYVEAMYDAEIHSLKKGQWVEISK
jgi:uncharacterized protein YfaS (alpha-2-macroglobulin family)